MCLNPEAPTRNSTRVGKIRPWLMVDGMRDNLFCIHVSPPACATTQVRGSWCCSCRWLRHTGTAKMPSVSPPPLWPRGPSNQVHHAALDGSVERLAALLSDGSVDIDQATADGNTPLMYASGVGHSSIARILLNKKADVSLVRDGNFAALHMSAQEGHPAVCKVLVEAGADLEAAASCEGFTPISLAAGEGHREVMSVLISAGANINSRCVDGTTPLFFAAQEGQAGAIKVLLRAKANPLLTKTDFATGTASLPLDIAAQNGHSEVVSELVQHVGIEGCGGATRGVEALRIAAMHQHEDIVALLMNAGAVDDGKALTAASMHDGLASVRFLLQRREAATIKGKVSYVNSPMYSGATPLLCATGLLGFASPSPRIVRLLVDAGADTTSAVRLASSSWNPTPLAAVTTMLGAKTIIDKEATEEELHKLERIRRLLLRVEAVHAVSWLWPVDIPALIGTAADSTSTPAATSTPVTRMLPLLRRRARRTRVGLAALFR